MARKRDVRAWLRKQLGKDTADTLLKKMNKMAKQGASPAKVRKAFIADIATHMAQRVDKELGIDIEDDVSNR